MHKKDLIIPTKEGLSSVVLLLKHICNLNLDNESDVFTKFVTRIKSIIGEVDKDDKTNVFDIIDEHPYWFDYVFSNIEKVGSDLYNGDGSIEHRIAYVCVELNILHTLPNANKRTSLLCLYILCEINNIDIVHDKDCLYDFALRVADKGNTSRMEHIEELREYLKTKHKK